MTFLVSNAALWWATVLATLGCVAWLAAEWRRPDGRRLPARLAATFLAVAALAFLALRPAWRGGGTGVPPGEIAAVLWTPATRVTPAPEGIGEHYRFALPGAHVPADAGATFLPDAATLRRRFPEVGRLRILGDGLNPAELPALAGLHVDFPPLVSPAPVAGKPEVRFLHCPRVLSLGDELIVEGRVGNLPSGKTAALTLEAPDGTATEVLTSPADANGEAGFTLRAPSPPAAGWFLWRLRLKETAGENVQVLAAENLGVEVRAPTLPRVLVLESAPQFDIADLRRWYEEAGGTMRARLRLGQDRYRFFAAGGAVPAEFNALDAPLLAGYDLVLADGRALAALPAPEREILRAAVADTGLGVLVLADDAVLPPAVIAPDRTWLFPWQLRSLDPPAAGTPGETEHLSRVTWPGLAQPSELPLPTEPFEIVLRPGQSDLVRDDQGRTLAALTMLGRGSLGFTLVRETGRRLRTNEPAAFAGYWSFLFARIARPLGPSGAWMLAGGDDGPVFVDQPLELVRTGPANGPPPGDIRVTDETGAAPVVLAPEGDPEQPGRLRVTFWPRRAGRHRVEADGGGLDFYVHPAGSWDALAVARKRAATARFAARSGTGPLTSAAARPVESTPIPAGWWFGVFLLGAGFLWTERRLSGA